MPLGKEGVKITQIIVAVLLPLVQAIAGIADAVRTETAGVDPDVADAEVVAETNISPVLC